MTRRLRGFPVSALLFLGLCAAPAAAQTTMTITGHVSAASMPVRSARIRVESLNLGATSDAEGRYSLIIPSARVRGQTVQMTVTYPRYRTQTVDIALTGGSLIRDFDLTSLTDAPAPDQRPGAAAPGNQPTANVPREANPTPTPVTKPAEQAPVLPTPGMSAGATWVRVITPSQVLDSTAFSDLAGTSDIAHAIQGRFAGVNVLTSSAVGGTNSIVVRGPRSLFGLTQPLVVVNGIIIDTGDITTSGQISGSGGFDYGTLLSDLNAEDVASVRLVTGPEAALRYGGRAANGVLLVTTRSARGLNGFEVAASQQITGSSIIKLPAYQNAFGQGLGGQFAFFDGKGGGINDATDQSWGPLLNGAPIPQASLTEAGRAEVRTWTAAPNNVSGYFQSGHSLATNVSLLGGNENGYLRGAFSNRSTTGVEPSTSLTIRSAALTAGGQLAKSLTMTGDLQLYNTIGEGRPGSGFDESNTVSTFSHMPRQVDLSAYQTHLSDATGAKLSWNYAGRNNPWMTTLENRNHDDRSRVIAGASGAFALSKWLTASGRFGADHSSDTRTFSVASGWMGGYPFYAGRGDFSNGGFENDDITRTATNAEVMLRGAPANTGGMSVGFTAGAGRRSDGLDFAINASDKVANASTPGLVSWSTNASTNYLFGGVEAAVRDMASINVGARQESGGPTGASSASTLYPAVMATIDLTRLDSGSRRGALESFIVHGGWSRTGNDATAGVLQRLGFNGASSAGLFAAVANPELTTGFEAGVSLRMTNHRFSADLTAYNDRSENLLFPSATSFAQTGTMTNKGVELAMNVVPVRNGQGLEWSIGANISRNNNIVESLAGGVASVALSTPFNGLSVEARTGQPLGVLVGYSYLRDGSGNMLLRKGLPVADSASGAHVLAQSAPSFIAGFNTVYRTHGVEFSALVDTHRGGKIFSASNRAAAISGVAAETGIRPDSGLLVVGLDAATGAPNTTHVTTEQYYHALSPIVERWLYDASFVKLREVRMTYTLPLQFISALNAQTIRAAFIGRNLATWSNAPNIDPETVLSTSTVRGAEMGQLPSTRALGVQVTLVP